MLENDAFVALLGASLFGVVVAALLRLPALAVRLVQRWLTVQVTIRERGPIRWVDEFVRSLPYGSSCRLLKFSRQDCDDSMDYALVPGHGLHLLRFQRHLIILERAYDGADQDNVGMSNLFRKEILHLRTAGRSRDTIEEFLSSARDLARSREGDTVRVYKNVQDSWWTYRVAAHRPLSSVILEDGLEQAVIERIERWRASENECRRLGIPWNLGLAFAGPPGTGKTSFAQALAGHLGAEIYWLGLSDPKLDDNLLGELIARVPRDSMVLIEDIDRHDFDVREDGSGVTVAGMLGALDGPINPGGRLMIITANDLDRLEPALVRPGRVDEIYSFGLATDEQAMRIYCRFFPGCRTSDAEQAVRSLAGLSPAAIQARLRDRNGKPNLDGGDSIR